MKRWRRYYGKRLLSQRGLSLVEVMIILVVVGLLLGASIVPFGTLWGEDAYAREREKMATLQEAIAGYAASHLTKERTVMVGGASDQRMFTLPAGRPYLPCPDIDGDGYEDRVGYDTTGAAALSPMAVLTVDFSASPQANELVQVGNCVVGRGTLPWKTLGTPPTDYWGSRYTYAVDDIFSNALIGFNQDTAIDSFDYREQVEIDINGDIRYRPRGASGITTLSIDRGGAAYNFNNYRRPIVVCDGGRVTLCQAAGAGSALPLDAGRLILATAMVVMPRRAYSPGDVIEGLPYVIVSHGHNRYGAVSGSDNLALVCNWPVNSAAAPAPAIIIADESRHEAVNFPQVEALTPNALRRCSPVTTSGGSVTGGFFVNQPRVRGLFSANGSADNFDDLVVWQTRQELTRYFVGAGILPADNFPVLRPY